MLFPDLYFKDVQCFPCSRFILLVFPASSENRHQGKPTDSVSFVPARFYVQKHETVGSAAYTNGYYSLFDTGIVLFYLWVI